jgi:hypothetical protein
MLKLSLRSALRLVAAIAALACGWIALATVQKAHAPVCSNPYALTTHGPARPSGTILCERIHVSFPTPAVGKTWLLGPTVAMSFAILAAVGFGLLAISPRQGSLLTYRWRRAVY